MTLTSKNAEKEGSGATGKESSELDSDQQNQGVESRNDNAFAEDSSPSKGLTSKISSPNACEEDRPPSNITDDSTATNLSTETFRHTDSSLESEPHPHRHPHRQRYVPTDKYVYIGNRGYYTYRAFPDLVYCPYCRKTVKAFVEREPGCCAFLSSAAICLLGGWICGLCLLPFCMEPCLGYTYVCPDCDSEIWHDEIFP